MSRLVKKSALTAMAILVAICRAMRPRCLCGAVLMWGCW